jgi:DNA-binding NarL/FixJ family response regulator
MNLSRGVAPPTQFEAENRVSIDSLAAEVRPREVNPPREEAPPIAISIVSNSRLLNEGLFTLLLPHLSLNLVGFYSGEFNVSSPPLNPLDHVVLLDSGIGWAAAIAWTRYWRGLIPSAFVIIMELANDIELILACIEAGVSGYTLEGASAGEVAQAIKYARHGMAHCSPEVTAQLYARVASLKSTVIQISVSPLTARESEILRYIANGYTNQEIAARLVIELRTVKQHVHHILGKLSSGNRREAVRCAVEQGWLERNPLTSLKRK